MKVEDCYYLGYISKTIGTKGDLALKLDVDSPSSYLNISSALLQIHPKDSQVVPYFVEQISLQNNGTLRCKFEGVNDQTAAKDLVGKSLFQLLTLLPKLKENQFYFHEIIGFEVEDKLEGKIGTVEKVLEYSTSNLLSVIFKEKEILIPISDETIVKVDKTNKTVFVHCPDGLIELYLEGA